MAFHSSLSSSLAAGGSALAGSATHCPDRLLALTHTLPGAAPHYPPQALDSVLAARVCLTCGIKQSPRASSRHALGRSSNWWMGSIGISCQNRQVRALAGQP